MRRFQTLSWAILPAACACLLLGSFPAAAAKAAEPVATFTAFAANMGTGRAGVVDITVNRWSTDEEREALLTTLQEFGPDKLLEALEKIRPPVGYIRTPNSVGWDLYYARDNAAPEGRRVVLATNRRVSFREAATNPRSMEYQFTLIEIHIGNNGKGDGKLVPAARVSWNHESKKLEIENYDALPVDLLNVVAKTPKG